MAGHGVLSPPKTEASSTTEPSSEQSGPIVAIPNEVHSVFSPTQKKLIVLTASTAAFFSPLSSNIYLPALNLIAQDLAVSDAKINLTITTYLIFQAVSPMMIAGFSDNAGRRPAYIICFILYIAANLGLALQENYIALLILRCLQSAGSSGTVAICQGVVADVATSAERGTYIAYSSVSTVLGPTLSPIIGGLLSQYLGWKAIFWFLIIFAVPVFILLMIFFPETCRKVVGNGSVPTRHLLNESLMSYLRKRKNRPAEDMDGEGQEVLPKVKLKFPNPLATLVILKNKEAALLMFYSGLLLAVHYIILASIPSEYGDLYNFNEMKIALAYIPYGLGSVLSAFTTGKLVNKNYQRHAKRLNFPLTLNKQLDLSYFPIEQARLEVALPLLYFGSAMIIIYGWVLNLKVNVAGPLILLFFIGWSVFAIYQVTSILVVDIYPENPATATAANNLIRCMFSAGATAAVVPMLRTLGRGWTYTFTAFVFMVLSPGLWLLMWYGPAWRREMKANSEVRETEKRRRIAERPVEI